MGRIVTNTYKTSDSVEQQDFYSGISISDAVEKKRVANGRIILTVGEGGESIWLLNENDEPIKIAQASDIRKLIELSGTVQSFSASVVFNYATSADTSESIGELEAYYEELSDAIDDINNRMAVIKSVADKALDGFEISPLTAYTSEQSGIKANYESGGSATIDFTNMMIDCGDY